MSNASLVVLFVVTVTFATFCPSGMWADEVADPQLRDIATAWERTLSSITSYSYSYNGTRTLLVTPEQAERLGMFTPPPERGTVLAAPNRIRVTRTTVPPPVPRGKEIIQTFDGTDLWSQPIEALAVGGMKRPLITKNDMDTLFFDFDPLALCWISLQLDSSPRESELRQECQPLAVLSRSDCKFEGTESVDGHACVVVSYGSFKVWLDPLLNYALRRRWNLYEGNRGIEINAKSHEQFGGHLWVPKQVEVTLYGTSLGPPELVGKPRSVQKTAIQSFTLNPPIKQADFQIAPLAGDIVFDTRLHPIDADGNEISSRAGVSYIQPADESRLEEVIKEATRSSGKQFEIDSAKGVTKYLVLGLNVVVIVAIVLVILVRRHNRRSTA